MTCPGGVPSRCVMHEALTHVGLQTVIGQALAELIAQDAGTGQQQHPPAPWKQWVSSRKVGHVLIIDREVLVDCMKRVPVSERAPVRRALAACTEWIAILADLLADITSCVRHNVSFQRFHQHHAPRVDPTSGREECRWSRHRRVTSVFRSPRRPKPLDYQPKTTQSLLMLKAARQSWHLHGTATAQQPAWRHKSTTTITPPQNDISLASAVWLTALVAAAVVSAVQPIYCRHQQQRPPRPPARFCCSTSAAAAVVCCSPGPCCCHSQPARQPHCEAHSGATVLVALQRQRSTQK